MTDKIEVFKQNSIRIQTEVGPVYIDPFEIDRETHDAAFVFVTHDHYDHFSPEDIRKVSFADTILIVPESMEKNAKKVADAVKKIETVSPGKQYETDGLTYETVAAYNIMKPFHAKSAGWVGYILSVNNQRIYIAGDTDATKEAKDVRCDIALIPIGGTYTMDAKKAAELINEIKPQTAIPTHYGSIVGKQSDERVFAEYVKDPVRVECKINF